MQNTHPYGRPIPRQQMVPQPYLGMSQPSNQVNPNDIALIMNKIRGAKTAAEREAMFADLKKTPQLYNAFIKMTKRVSRVKKSQIKKKKFSRILCQSEGNAAAATIQGFTKVLTTLGRLHISTGDSASLAQKLVGVWVQRKINFTWIKGGSLMSDFLTEDQTFSFFRTHTSTTICANVALFPVLMCK
jgi:hypothetical protein